MREKTNIGKRKEQIHFIQVYWTIFVGVKRNEVINVFDEEVIWYLKECLK